MAHNSGGYPISTLFNYDLSHAHLVIPVSLGCDFPEKNDQHESNIEIVLYFFSS